jgi:hypothetical protein
LPDPPGVPADSGFVDPKQAAQTGSGQAQMHPEQGHQQLVFKLKGIGVAAANRPLTVGPAQPFVFVVSPERHQTVMELDKFTQRDSGQILENGWLFL